MHPHCTECHLCAKTLKFTSPAWTSLSCRALYLVACLTFPLGSPIGLPKLNVFQAELLLYVPSPATYQPFLSFFPFTINGNLGFPFLSFFLTPYADCKEVLLASASDDVWKLSSFLHSHPHHITPRPSLYHLLPELLQGPLNISPASNIIIL